MLYRIAHNAPETLGIVKLAELSHLTSGIEVSNSDQL